MSSLYSYDNIMFMLSGLKLTLIIAIATTISSVIIGTFLAVTRNYCKGKFKILGFLATAYIEIFRCTPNILWILIFRFTLKGDPIFLGIFSFTIFTSAVVAEIIRGGLNAIPTGQIEAGTSQGFNFLQILLYIILPQTFRAIIPSLFSQVTTIVKDTSYLKVIDIHEFMLNSTYVMNKANTVGQIIVMYGFVALTYFAINFGLSYCVSLYHRRIKIA